jgi:hypothetical protein
LVCGEFGLSHLRSLLTAAETPRRRS